MRVEWRHDSELVAPPREQFRVAQQRPPTANKNNSSGAKLVNEATECLRQTIAAGICYEHIGTRRRAIITRSSMAIITHSSMAVEAERSAVRIIGTVLVIIGHKLAFFGRPTKKV